MSDKPVSAAQRSQVPVPHPKSTIDLMTACLKTMGRITIAERWAPSFSSAKKRRVYGCDMKGSHTCPKSGRCLASPGKLDEVQREGKSIANIRLNASARCRPAQNALAGDC